MNSRHIPADRRTAAVTDYNTSSDTYAVVAARHGVSKSALQTWVHPDRPVVKRGPKDTSDIAYNGGWERIGGILRPLFPERRSA